MDESFINDCLGKDPGATAYWKAFEQANPGYGDILEEARRCVAAMYAWGESTDIEEQWDKLQEMIVEKRDEVSTEVEREKSVTIGEAPVISVVPRKRLFGLAGMMALAVAVIGVLLFTGLHIYEKKQPESISYVTLSAPDGTVRRCDLPDGSIVWLDAGSTIRYKGGDAGRRIELLDGEIFCKVKHDTVHPFSVLMPGGLVLKDIGTSFDIQSYKGLAKQVVKVMEGAVALVKTDHVLKLLSKGQGIGINTIDGTLTQFDHSNSDDAPWIRGRIELNDISFRELAIVLEKTYGIHIIFEKRALMDCKASTSFNRNDPVRDVLNALKLIYGMTYTTNGDTLILHGAGHPSSIY